MHPDPQRIDSIFLVAAEKATAAERAAYLDAACAGDPALRERVERLLAAQSKVGRFLEAPAPALIGTVEESPATERPGTLVGPYKLLESIGEGGMGTVWMAEQIEPIQRRVAVKVVKEGMDSKQVLARFEAERQALALMEHPNIARVLDAGKTPSGRPYFVMELVKGQPITRYCDEKRLGVRERLELFGDVCRAVQHAHQKGVIHRDLKPSNVLVAPYDGKPVVKVIDFGVAKATGQRLTDKTLFTGFGAFVGTPEYMSPEQAEVNNQDIDTRSDIYALGVLLYELLTGSTPLTRKRLKEAALLEVLRVIREEEPPKPSTRLLDSKESLPSISAQRQTEPAKLTKLVRGELDWIVMKALEKDRNRRYETANGFAMDVQRYLADESVLACPPSAGYQLRKFARRNKGRLAVAALVLFLVVLFGSGVGWVVRDRSAREAETVRQQGERQAKVAGEVESIFGEVDRLEKEQKWPEALEAARRAEAAVAGGDADAPTAERVHQRLRDLEFIDELERIRMEAATLDDGRSNWAGADRDYARVFREYGVDVDALPVETSIDRLRARPALALALAAALDEWVHMRRLLSEGEIDRWKRLVAVARGIDPEPMRDRLRAAWGQPVANVRDDLRRLAESIDVRAQHPATLFVLVRTLTVVALPDTAMRIVRDAQNLYPGDFWLNTQLGFYLDRRNDHEGGIRFLTAAVAIRPNSALAHDILGHALIHQKRFNEAIAACRRATELDPKSFPAHSDLGFALQHIRCVDEAITEYQKALELLPMNAGATKGSHTHNNFGAALADKGRMDEAIAEFKKAIEIDPENAHAHNNLGNNLRNRGHVDEAIAEYKKAIEIDPKYAPLHTCLGNALLDKGLVDEAIAEHKKAIKLDPKMDAGYTNLGNSLVVKGRVDEAIALYKKAIELDPKSALTYYGLGNALHQKKDLDGAVAEYRKAIKLDPRSESAHHILYETLKCKVFAHTGLGTVLREQGKLDEAVGEFRKAIELDPKYAIAHNNLGNALFDQRKLDQAVAEYRKAIELDPKDAGAHFNLGNALQRQNKLDEAVAEWRKAIELDPKDAGAHFNLGNVLYFQKKRDEAITEWRKTIEFAPKKSAGAHNNLGNVLLYDQGKLDEAVGEFRKAVELEPADAQYHNNLGNALHIQKKLDEAVTEWRKVIELDPKNAGAHSNLGIGLLDQGKVDEAVAEHRKAVKLAPQSAFAWQVLGWALYRAGDWKASIAALEKSCALGNPKGGDAAQWIVMALAHGKMATEKELPEKERALHKAEAHRWYDQAVKQINTWGPGGNFVIQATRAFRVEAAELLGIKEKQK